MKERYLILMVCWLMVLSCFAAGCGSEAENTANQKPKPNTFFVGDGLIADGNQCIFRIEGQYYHNIFQKFIYDGWDTKRNLVLQYPNGDNKFLVDLFLERRDYIKYDTWPELDFGSIISDTFVTSDVVIADGYQRIVRIEGNDYPIAIQKLARNGWKVKLGMFMKYDEDTKKSTFDFILERYAGINYNEQNKQVVLDGSAAILSDEIIADGTQRIVRIEGLYYFSLLDSIARDGWKVQEAIQLKYHDKSNNPKSTIDFVLERMDGITQKDTRGKVESTAEVISMVKVADGRQWVIRIRGYNYHNNLVNFVRDGWNLKKAVVLSTPTSETSGLIDFIVENKSAEIKKKAGIPKIEGGTQILSTVVFADGKQKALRISGNYYFGILDAEVRDGWEIEDVVLLTNPSESSTVVQDYILKAR